MYTSSFFHFFPPVLSLLFIIFFLFLLFPFMFPPFFIVLFSTCTWQILSFFIWIIAGHRLTGEKENSSNVSFQPMWIIQSKFTNEWTCESSMKMETGIFLQLTWFFSACLLRLQWICTFHYMIHCIVKN